MAGASFAAGRGCAALPVGRFIGFVLLCSMACLSITELEVLGAVWSTHAMAMLITTMKMASPHVVFSRKSVVLRTPIIWFDDENPEASPPPFEF